MAPHSSTLAWKIPWMEEPGRLQSMGLLRVGHHWATSLWLITFMHWRRKWQPTPVFLPGESQGWGSLVGGHLGVSQSQTRLKRLGSSILPGSQHLPWNTRQTHRLQPNSFLANPLHSLPCISWPRGPTIPRSLAVFLTVVPSYSPHCLFIGPSFLLPHLAHSVASRSRSLCTSPVPIPAHLSQCTWISFLNNLLPK